MLELCTGGCIQRQLPWDQGTDNQLRYGTNAYANHFCFAVLKLVLTSVLMETRIIDAQLMAITGLLLRNIQKPNKNFDCTIIAEPDNVLDSASCPNMVLHGGCLCRSVRYKVDIDAVEGSTNFCHCRMCQLATGSPVGAFVTVSEVLNDLSSLFCNVPAAFSAPQKGSARRPLYLSKAAPAWASISPVKKLSASSVKIAALRLSIS